MTQEDVFYPLAKIDIKLAHGEDVNSTSEWLDDKIIIVQYGSFNKLLNTKNEQVMKW